MSSISNGSTDVMILRFKQLEDVVEALQKENKSLKNKLRTLSTFSTFYHEARQQMGELNTQLSTKDNVIEDLKARLARYEATSVQVGGEERLITFGPSKSLVENLIEELAKVKQQLKDSEKQVGTLSQEVQTLQQQLQEKSREIQRIINSPQNEKDIEIFQLQRLLKETEVAQATKEVLCRSLTEESEQLRLRLASTADMCQQLAKRLAEETRLRGQGTLEEQIHTQQTSKVRCAQQPSVIDKLQEENKVLKKKLSYVEDLNAKWQKYDASREEYVKNLHLQLKELRSHTEVQKGLVPVQTNAEMMQQEILRLNKLLGEKIKDCNQAKQKLEEIVKDQVHNKEQIQMLQQQVLVYKDDFQSERRDRERAQGKIQELQEEAARLHQQLTRRKDARESAGQVRIHFGNRKHIHIETDVTDPLLGSSSPQLGVNRWSTSAELEEPVVINRSSGSDRRVQGELQCPQCQRLFNDGEECLKHISECFHETNH